MAPHLRATRWRPSTRPSRPSPSPKSQSREVNESGFLRRGNEEIRGRDVPSGSVWRCLGSECGRPLPQLGPGSNVHMVESCWKKCCTCAYLKSERCQLCLTLCFDKNKMSRLPRNVCLNPKKCPSTSVFHVGTRQTIHSQKSEVKAPSRGRMSLFTGRPGKDDSATQ